VQCETITPGSEPDPTHINYIVFISLPEWYRGVIRSASADRVEWEVQFEDGDFDTAICRKCVRPYLPYTLDEEVDWRDSDEDVYYRGRVMDVMLGDGGEELYDIRLDGYLEVLRDISPVDMRRFENLSDPDGVFDLGTRVVAMYDGMEDEWYPGVITRRNKDGTFRIIYDDGDIDEQVPLQFMMLDE
jgi:hypothetical protein